MSKAKSERQLGEHLKEKPLLKVSVLKPITAKINYGIDKKFEEQKKSRQVGQTITRTGLSKLTAAQRLSLQSISESF
jgi:hypothetical protein